MFLAEINVKDNDFRKFDLIENDKHKIIFYTTQGGMYSPDTKVKCILNNRLRIISMVNLGKCLHIDLKRKITSDELKELLNRESSSNGVLSYDLKMKGVVSGIEEDSIVFNVSQIIIMPTSVL